MLPMPHYVWFMSHVRLFQASMPLYMECYLPKMPFSYCIYKKLLFTLQNPIMICTCAGLWGHRRQRCSLYYRAPMRLGPPHCNGCRHLFQNICLLKLLPCLGQPVAAAGTSVKWHALLTGTGVRLGWSRFLLDGTLQRSPPGAVPRACTPCYSIYEVLFWQSMREITPCLFKIELTLTFMALIIKTCVC